MTIALFAVILMLQLAPQQVLMPELVSDHFGRGVGAYGLLTTVFGVGTVSGALAFGQSQPRRRRGVVNYAFWLANSLAIAALALSPWFELAAFFALIRGFCVGFGVAMWETMLQELVPVHLLSRVVSLDFFGSFGLMPVGLAFAAAIAGLASAGNDHRRRRARLRGDDRRDDDAPLAPRGGVTRFRCSPRAGTCPRKEVIRMAYGILLLRIVVGTTMAGHGVQKLLGWFDGPGSKGTEQMFRKLGFPAAAAHGDARRPCGDGRPALRRRSADAAGRPRHRDRDAERDRLGSLEERLLELRRRLRVPARDARGRGRAWRRPAPGRFSADAADRLGRIDQRPLVGTRRVWPSQRS